MSSSSSITELLAAASAGDDEAREQAWERAYPELKKIAHRELGRRQPGQTLQTTSLVNEAYSRLADRVVNDVTDRTHFYALAVTAMRHILIDYARGRRRLKRGGEQRSLPLTEEYLKVSAINSVSDFSENLIDLDTALYRLAKFDPRAASVVECRFFAGLGVNETASVLKIAPRTVKRDWAAARAWLLRELRK